MTRIQPVVFLLGMIYAVVTLVTCRDIARRRRRGETVPRSWYVISASNTLGSAAYWASRRQRR